MIATHDVDQARAWDRVLCLNRRQVAFGPPDATLTAPCSRPPTAARSSSCRTASCAPRPAGPPPPLMVAVARRAHRAVDGSVARRALSRSCCSASSAARWGAGSSSTTSPTAPSRWRTGCFPGSWSPAHRRAAPARRRRRLLVAALAIAPRAGPAIGRDTAIAVGGDDAARRRGAAGAVADSPPGLRGSCSATCSASGRRPRPRRRAAVLVVGARVLHGRLLAVASTGSTRRGLGRFTAGRRLALLVALAILVAVQGLGNLLVVAVLVGPAARRRGWVPAGWPR